MPRRSRLFIAGFLLISLVCYQRAIQNPYARYFEEVLDLVEQRALDPVSSRKLYEAAVEGVLGELDEYSGYISPQNAQQFHEDLDQEFAGVGIRMRFDPDTRSLVVISPIVGTPAHRAGIEPGDVIKAIDGEATGDFQSTDDAVRAMRGKQGETVVLTIDREGEPDPREVTIQRTMIKVDSVMGDQRRADGSWDFRLESDPRIGYVRVHLFGGHTVDELRDALKSLVEHDARSLILDLRGNAGGLLEAGVETCDLFLESGTIVTTRNRAGEILESFEAGPKDTFSNLPMAVLVNSTSASASEIVAACLQDHGRAVVVGERTWGKGTVQQVLEIEGGQALLRLTTAAYWRPSGANIHRVNDAELDDIWGVHPDPGFDVPLDEDRLRQLGELRRQRDLLPNHRLPEDVSASYIFEADAQLEKAVHYLQSLLDPEQIAWE